MQKSKVWFHLISIGGKSLGIYFCIFIVILCGCSGVKSRIKEYQMQFDGYPPEIQHLIKKGIIRRNFTRTQVYIAKGDPFDQQPSRWTYTACAKKKVVVLKDRFFYESDYKSAWQSYLDEKKKNKDAVFIPPDRFEEDVLRRRYVDQYVFFENNRVTRIERPSEVVWIDPTW